MNTDDEAVQEVFPIVELSRLIFKFNNLFSDNHKIIYLPVL